MRNGGSLANNAKSNKIQNRQTILKLLALNAPVSRVELSALSGLSKMSLSNIVGEFIEDGLVDEIGVDNTAAGKRKPVLLDLKQGGAVAAGVFLSKNTAEGCVADLKGNILRTDRKKMTNPFATEAGLEFVSDLLCAVDYPISGIGVSFDQTVSKQNAATLTAEIEKQFSPIPVFLAPTAHAQLLSEKYYGGEKGAMDMLCITDKNALEMAVLCADQILLGKIGHIIVEPNGEKCSCGKQGCLHLYASCATVKTDADMVRQCQYLATSILNFIELFNPQAVVLCGDLAKNTILNGVKALLQDKTSVRVSASALGSCAQAFGSCAVVFENLYFG